MKLREKEQRYSIGKHGREYVDYSAPALICPECQSDKVREIGDEETGRDGDYLCQDCGCEFDTWIESERTAAGEKLSTILTAISAITAFLAFVFLIGGLAYAIHLDNLYPNDTCPEYLVGRALWITFGGFTGNLFVAITVAHIEDKI